MKVSLTLHQKKFISRKMSNGGYRSRSEVVREALRLYELAEQDDGDPSLEAALRQALRSPSKKYKSGHFTALASQHNRRKIAA